MYIVDCAPCIPFSIVTKYTELACSYVKSSCLGMHKILVNCVHTSTSWNCVLSIASLN